VKARDVDGQGRKAAGVHGAGSSAGSRRAACGASDDFPDHYAHAAPGTIWRLNLSEVSPPGITSFLSKGNLSAEGRPPKVMQPAAARRGGPGARQRHHEARTWAVFFRMTFKLM
jgi:hypothetical protein